MITTGSRRKLRIKYLEENLRAKGWNDFLRRIGHHTNKPLLPFTTSPTIPPTYIRTNDDMWEYLRNIAAGFVLVPGCGLVCRGKLRQFLRENDPAKHILSEGEDQKTTCPDCGATIPNNGHCWYCENDPRSTQ
jgi:hypothetical protein